MIETSKMRLIFFFIKSQMPFTEHFSFITTFFQRFIRSIFGDGNFGDKWYRRQKLDPKVFNRSIPSGKSFSSSGTPRGWSGLKTPFCKPVRIWYLPDQGFTIRILSDKIRVVFTSLVIPVCHKLRSRWGATRLDIIIFKFYTISSQFVHHWSFHHILDLIISSQEPLTVTVQSFFSEPWLLRLYESLTLW